MTRGIEDDNGLEQAVSYLALARLRERLDPPCQCKLDFVLSYRRSHIAHVVRIGRRRCS